MQYLGIVLVPVLWFWFALAQTARRHWLRFPRAGLFLVVPAVVMTAALAWQPGNVLWEGFQLPPAVPIPKTDYGPLFYVMAAWDYVLVLGGCALLTAHYMQSPHYRVPLLVTGVIPVLLISTNAIYIAGHWPLPQTPHRWRSPSLSRCCCGRCCAAACWRCRRSGATPRSTA